MIELKNVYRTFKNGDKNIRVLKDINIHINAGEFIAIMGPSASAKSTLINILGFIDRGYHGEYLFEGSNYQTQSDNQLANIRNKQLDLFFKILN